jgi:SOS-response transcriptional repressor LexA
VKQREVLRLIVRVTVALGEPPSQRSIARRLGINLFALQHHLEALYQKGWLKNPTPGGLRCTHEPHAE